MKKKMKKGQKGYDNKILNNSEKGKKETNKQTTKRNKETMNEQ